MEKYAVIDPEMTYCNRNSCPKKDCPKHPDSIRGTKLASKVNFADLMNDEILCTLC